LSLGQRKTNEPKSISISSISHPEKKRTTYQKATASKNHPGYYNRKSGEVWLAMTKKGVSDGLTVDSNDGHGYYIHKHVTTDARLQLAPEVPV